jgi:hypothetical protein
LCHIKEHPYKAVEILAWELRRQYRIAASFGTKQFGAEQETEEEQREAQYEEEVHVQQREEEREREEPAWNLGHYKSSGYCIADVEEEEFWRRHYEK